MRALPGLLLLLAVGCANGKDDARVEAPVARVQAESGPVRVVVEVRPAPLQLSEIATLTLRVVHPDDVELEPIDLAQAHPGFTLRDEDPPVERVENGATVLERRLRIEPDDEGERQLGPFEVRFRKGGEEGAVSTEPLAVVVGTTIPPEDATLDALEGPLGPVAPPPAGMPLWPWLLAAAAVVVAAAWFALRRRRKEPAAPPLTPAQLAARELDALLADDPLSRGDVAGFYSELTLIVRRWVERTTGIRAPEMTTPEFLRSMGRRPDADPLRAFLEAADLVKFAGQRPDRAAIDAAVDRARELVGLLPGLAGREEAA